MFFKCPQNVFFATLFCLEKSVMLLSGDKNENSNIYPKSQRIKRITIFDSVSYNANTEQYGSSKIFKG